MSDGAALSPTGAVADWVIPSPEVVASAPERLLEAGPPLSDSEVTLEALVSSARVLRRPWDSASPTDSQRNAGTGDVAELKPVIVLEWRSLLGTYACFLCLGC